MRLQPSVHLVNCKLDSLFESPVVDLGLQAQLLDLSCTRVLDDANLCADRVEAVLAVAVDLAYVLVEQLQRVVNLDDLLRVDILVLRSPLNGLLRLLADNCSQVRGLRVYEPLEGADDPLEAGKFRF